MKILSEEAVPAARAKEILDGKIEEEGATYEQKITMDYLRRNIEMDPDDCRELCEELEGIGRMNAGDIAQIVNVMPNNEDEVRMLFKKSSVKLRDEEIGEVLDVVEKYS